MTGAAPLLVSDPPVDVRERALLAAIAANVARLRRNAGMDLDRLAEISGLPVEQLVAIEAGIATLRLRTLWALADAFEVPFGVLLSGAPCATTTFHVLRATEGVVVASERGEFRTRSLSTAGDPREPEVYAITLAPGWTEEAAPHATDTFEHIVVVRGELEIHAGPTSARLTAGDVVFFRADVAHAYHNPGTRETILHLTMTYAGD